MSADIYFMEMQTRQRRSHFSKDCIIVVQSQLKTKNIPFRILF
jgi:hypothetical protein